MTINAVAHTNQRVVALYEPGHSGSATLDLAGDLVERDAAKLTVLGVAPQAPAGKCCGATSPADYNHAVCDAVAMELRQARDQLGSIAERATFKLLIEGTDPPPHEWIAAGNFDLVLLPARRRLLRAGTHPAAARLQRATRAEVRVVQPKAKRGSGADDPSQAGLRQTRGQHGAAG